MIKTIIKAEKIFAFLLENSLIILITSISVLEVVQVILRYILHMPMQSVEEILVIPSIWFYFLGAVYASKKDEHINARILEIFMKKEKSITIIRTLSAFVGLIVTGWLGYWAYDFCVYSFRVGKVSLILRYPMQIIETALFLCLIPMFLYTLSDFIKYTNILTCKLGREE